MNLLSKFPSFDTVIRGAVATFKRYPLTLLSALLATAMSVELIDLENSEHSTMLEKLQITGALGIPLFVALVHFAEKRMLRKPMNLALQAAGVILLLAYYLTLPQDITGAIINYVRFLLLAIGLHFLVAVLPFVGGKHVQGFWQYNKSLFLRFLTAALYSGVLYIGLTIALAAADHLFGMDVDEKRYFQLWVIIVGVFNTWVFLGGTPEDLNKLGDDYAYPKGLKVFTQYILLPLVALYFIILIAYEAKIIVEWNWPKGWVSHLVLWYSVVGILSALLLYPLRELAGNRWIQVFIRWFYRALIPLVVLLFLAIMRRISEYGITENRYFVLAMAIGLTIVVIYFIVSRVKDIRIIPGILCILAFLSALGPWSAFSISKNDQQGRLEAIMSQYDILVDGVIRKATGEIPLEDRQQMSSIVSYLNEWHGLESFADWLPNSALASLDTVVSWKRDNEITRLMGFEWVKRFPELNEGRYFSVTRRLNESYIIADYEHLVEFQVSDEKEILWVDSIQCNVTFDMKQQVLRVRLGEGEHGDSLVEMSLAETLKQFVDYRKTNAEPELMTLSGECSAFDARVVCEQISGYWKADSLTSAWVRGDLLLRLK